MDNIINGLKTSLIDKDVESNLYYQHLLIKNDQSHTMLSMLKKLIAECDEFYFSVAFVTTNGVQSLLKTFTEANERGIKGKIITGNYQYFTNPRALERLDVFENIEVRMDFDSKLHAKGYFFKINNEWKIIIGSSNMTISAFSSNTEWNLLLSSTNDGKLIYDSLETFNDLYKSSTLWSDCKHKYIQLFEEKRLFNNKFNQASKENFVSIVPNKMQTEALISLSNLRIVNETKAILISATGSGKTYLSAFDVKRVNPDRCLFVVHRSTILKNALKTFKTIIKNKTMGIYDGVNKDIECDYVFANIATLSKNHNLEQFDRNQFDYIVIDEVHKSGADSYQKVLDYFNPKFLLGMTATPERTDGFNIFNLFDNNIAYEIRLKEAVEHELVVPFHYYGVTDICDENGMPVMFSNLSYNMRVDNIIEKSKLYGYDGNKVRGLIFINNIEEALRLEVELNKRGLRSKAITGKNIEFEREEAIHKLGLSYDDDYLDYIITVDVFNEGVDIPYVNQVILLRPTLSSIIYTQQIGRGLRLSDGKEYLVIIDFIANYEKNFLIPIALTGDTSFDLDRLKEIVVGGSTGLLDNCTIEFEMIPQKTILDNISKKLNKSSVNFKKIFQEDYKLLKFRLNRVPLLLDFYNADMLTPEMILNIKVKNDNNQIVRGYHNLLQYLMEFDLELSSRASFYLEFLYYEFGACKRIHETLILKYLLQDNFSADELTKLIEKELDVIYQEENVRSALNHLSDKIFTKDTARVNFKKIGDINIVVQDDEISLVDDFKKIYEGSNDFKMLLDDLIEFNIKFIKDKYLQTSKEPIKLFGEYTKKEIFHIMNDDHNAGLIISGYRKINNTNIVMIFSKLDKSSYENVLASESIFKWVSQTNRSYGKSKLETNIADNKTDLRIFLRRAEGEKYYYIGQADVESFEQSNMGDIPVIRYDLKLRKEVKETLYTYLTMPF